MSSVMDSIYNNYLTTYSPLPQTRYDTHKKSELRSVYNSIVKLNKESPWYLPTTNKDTQQYAVNIKENARMLHNTIATLGGLEEAGLLNKKQASSSNEDLVSVTYIGDSASQEDNPGFSIEIKQLASSQENLGEFKENGRVALRQGTYSFDVSINDMNYEFQFSIDENETNRNVQERLAKLINNSNIGISASVEEENSRTALRLKSDSTGLPPGKDNIFTISDNQTSMRAGTVAYFGLDYVSHPATNAEFEINGEEHNASSNHFTVGKLFELELKGISEEGKTEQIGLKADLESLTDNISQLIGSYNSFIKTASNYIESQSRSKNLIKEMNGIASLYQEEMEKMGLGLDAEGILSIDKDKLEQSVSESEDISESFEYLKDFSNRLLRKTNQISINPMNYVDKTIVAYKNPGHNFTSPYAASAYSGMMFNFYC